MKQLTSLLALALFAFGCAALQRHDTSVGYLFVTNEGSNDLTILDMSQKKVLKTIHAGSMPGGIATTSDGRYAFVANYSGTVSKIDLSIDRIVASVESGSGPTGLTSHR